MEKCKIIFYEMERKKEILLPYSAVKLVYFM